MEYWNRLIQEGANHAQNGKLQEALKCWEAARLIRPNSRELLLNIGTIKVNLGTPREAIPFYNEALQISPLWDEAWNAKGNALLRISQFSDAIQCYDKALSILPTRIDSLYSRGTAFSRTQKFALAAENYEQALRLKPDFIEALYGYGTALSQLGKLPEAIASYEKVAKINPRFGQILGILQHTRMKICDWQDSELLNSDKLKDYSMVADICAPFEALTFWDNPEKLRQCAQFYCQKKYPSEIFRKPIATKNRRKIHIGYFSADLHKHATAYLMAGLFEHHDKSKFCISVYSFRSKTDVMTERIRRAVGKFIDISALDDAEAIQAIRRDELDIAIDLKGYTELARPGLFAHGIAPIQVSYLGFPGTMGAKFIDYIIADHTVIQTHVEPHFTEKIVYLPFSYQANDNKRHISENQVSREALRLPSSGIIYCCFNNNFKFTPIIFSSWMRVLMAVPNSILWLLADNEAAQNNLLIHAERAGIDPSRLIFAPRVDADEHLARLQLADLFLDTLPYNAHTSASDALWVGLPVLTCQGESFASRVAASLLKAVGLPDLITNTVSEYEEAAIAFGQNPKTLKQVKERLLINRERFPLFNTKLFTHGIEAAYQVMKERSVQGFPPETFTVKSFDDTIYRSA